MLAAACGLVAGVVPAPHARAQTAGSTTTTTKSAAAEQIVVNAKRRLVKEKNSPSAVTELGSKEIASTGVSGSVSSLLRQAPSVYVYQQGIGDNAPVLTIRGLRGLEVATTLDGVPIQDLEAPGASYNANNIGSYLSLDQINGVSIYPGVAYPNRNTFGTIGGTVAYDSLRPSKDEYIDVTGEAGFFGTYKEGIVLNSGAVDSPLGTGDNAASVLAQYANLQSNGFIDYTESRYNTFEFAADKPYDDGQSKFQATVLYNSATGLFENEPVPLAYLKLYGNYSNYDTSVWQDRESNDYLTVILKNDKYVNDLIPDIGLTAFYLQNDSSNDTYAGINDLAPTGSPSPVTIGSGINAISPFINNPAGFGYGYAYGAATGGAGASYYGPGQLLYNSAYPYNPAALYPVGSKYCPTKIANQYIAEGLAIPCGLNSQLAIGHNYTYGLQPRMTIDPPDYFGITQSIQLGGILAKETSPSTADYFGATPNVTPSASNLSNFFGGGFDGGTERTIYQGYLQDKVTLLDGTLHLTPGATLEGTKSSYSQSNVFNGVTGAYEAFKAVKWDREFLPFFNITYDFDKIAPVLKGASVYGSVGNSALFAPTTDFGPSANGVPPYASIVHLYEGGIVYNTPTIAAHFDYFYQKVDRDFGFFQNQSPPDVGEEFYTNSGEREFKGVEGAVTWQVTPELQLFGNASWTRARYLQTDFAFVTVAEDQYGIGIRGAPVTGIPDWLSTFGADYTKKSLVRDGDTFNVRVTEQYTGSQATTYDVNAYTGFSSIPSFQGELPNGPCVLNGTPAQMTGCGRFSQLSGDTVYDPNGGIKPYFLTNLDLNYTLPTPFLPAVKRLKFDLNVQNLFNHFYWQYLYKQVSPGACQPTPKNPTASPYGCSLNFSDGIPGQPLSVFFTVTARF
jgi:iron complex outermembrane receptor protein